MERTRIKYRFILYGNSMVLELVKTFRRPPNFITFLKFVLGLLYDANSY